MSHSSAFIGITSTEAKTSNMHRKYMLVFNASDTGVWLKFGETAVLYEGIYLAPDMVGSYEMGDKWGNLDTRALYGIQGASGTKKILITEYP